jgi:hypothetical protein
MQMQDLSGSNGTLTAQRKTWRGYQNNYNTAGSNDDYSY